MQRRKLVHRDERKLQDYQKSRSRRCMAVYLGGCLFAAAITFLLTVTTTSLAFLENDDKSTEGVRLRSEYVSSSISFDDADCPFRHSPIYRKVFVYPDYGSREWKQDVTILSSAGRQGKTPQWPWLAFDQASWSNQTSHYNVDSQLAQYTTELLVREVMTNPKSCLRTYDPEEATLFYVPYLCSIEHHRGQAHVNAVDYNTSPWGMAIMDILDYQNITSWEEIWGLTGKYWQRRQGADHILVFSEPFHGLFHPRSKRGSYHYIHTQKQLKSPIVISVELSRSFVEKYPQCARKNILMPYPNPNGQWFNGVLNRQVEEVLQSRNISATTSRAALPVERSLATSTSAIESKIARPASQYYMAGKHGSCKKLRNALTFNYEKCSASNDFFTRTADSLSHGQSMRLATFCPCPGGDSPSAKRMFDAILVGCIPVVLSHDFVWPWTVDYDSKLSLHPSDFAVSLTAKSYNTPLDVHKNCTPNNASLPAGLEETLSSISATEIARLRKGMDRVRDSYAWYRMDHPDLPDNPLWSRILPDGGAARMLVDALAERASGSRWPACDQELHNLQQRSNKLADPTNFKC